VNIRKSNGLIIHLIRGLAVRKLAPPAITVTPKLGRSELVLFDGKIIRVAGQRKAIGKNPSFKREHGQWPRVFCASLADAFDNQDLSDMAAGLVLD
jgi:hypothetical protein